MHVAPELAFSLPTGSARPGRGANAVGFGVAVPVSVTLTRALVAHAYAGASHLPGTEDESGVRGALNLGNVQLVPGLAMPIGFADGETDTGWLLYLSVEHSFR